MEFWSLRPFWPDPSPLAAFTPNPFPSNSNLIMQAHQFLPGLLILLAPLPATLLAQEEQRSPELQAPFQVLCGEQPLDVGDDVGHAAPFMADMDGDGLRDLLVGVFGKGVKKKGDLAATLRVYKNLGKKGEPRFASFEYFQAGGTQAAVPGG